MNIVISQPMFFPWVGMFEQIRLADVYVHYSDVQFSKGSFVNRVQIKTATGSKWLTVPLSGLKFGQRINEVRINHEKDWCSSHLQQLEQAYASAPYFNDMMALVVSVYDEQYENIDQLSKATLDVVCRYYGLDKTCKFIDIGELEITGASSERVLDIVLTLGGTRYITGLGALKYLDHPLFERHDVRVDYMDYQKVPYTQLHGEFTPYVSILDLIANEGKAGIRCIASGTVYWKELLSHE